MKFLKDNKVRVVGIGLFDDSVTNKTEANVHLDSREDLEKAMKLTGRRTYPSANEKHNQIFFKRTKNRLHVFYISSYDHRLPEKEIIQQVKEVFRSKIVDAAVVKKVVRPKNQETSDLTVFVTSSWIT